MSKIVRLKLELQVTIEVQDDYDMEVPELVDLLQTDVWMSEWYNHKAVVLEQGLYDYEEIEE